MLPCVLLYIHDVCVDRILGFEGLGEGTDNFTTRDLESRLLSSSVLQRAKVGGYRSAQRRSKEESLTEDDDWD